ncbi:phytanoyl-CoA dioxygenase family protein [Bradyrhizobium canariense]|uniref:phytanoyl-CoA dioxygenase family protein n=1 Tax=Bradyrhizobium canariense TaxID=255045 RepID=UPI001B8A2437|nr:phytanoyl-CoA dioxygenase family protein [Bradyrhizobium canariense]MBR0953311.1 phytanoyl-CoA dioxygenase family protein [Bradyrhizobium canariense]
MSELLTPAKVDPLDAQQAAALDRDGYLLLRGAVPEAWRDALRAAFDSGVGAGDQWAAPRGVGWRHALVDLDPAVRQTCRLPLLLAAGAQMLGGPFFLAQVEGREPLQGGGHQRLHRDGAGMKAVAALVFLDDYGPDNGATRLVPRHLDQGRCDQADPLRADLHQADLDQVLPDETLSLTIAGEAGDILVFDADLPHGATRNRSGARRRSLLLSFMPERNRATMDGCRAVRNVRMDTSEVFVPSARAVGTI